MTLPEMLGMLGMLLGLVAGVILGVLIHLGWWSCGTALGGLFLGWCAGVALTPLADRLAQRSWERQKSNRDEQAEQ
jgi:hypothetical protein